MIIKDATWQEIREQFDFREKLALTEAIDGQLICPAAFSVNLDQLKEPLRTKVQDAVKGAAA